MPILAPYRKIVGGTRDFAHSMHQSLEGDPMKAAAAIAHAGQLIDLGNYNDHATRKFWH
jgi:hypothetical protein